MGINVHVKPKQFDISKYYQ